MAAVANDLITLAQAYAWLGITNGSDDANLQLAITAYSQLIADWCSRTFVATNFNEVYDGHDSRRLMLRNYPINSVSSLSINGRALCAVTTICDPGYKFSGRSVDLFGGMMFCRGLENIAISYNAGFVAIPADLQMACLDWMKAGYLSRQRDSGLAAQQAGDHAEKYLPGGAVTILGTETAPMPASVYAVLSQYRNTLPV